MAPMLGCLYVPTIRLGDWQTVPKHRINFPNFKFQGRSTFNDHGILKESWRSLFLAHTKIQRQDNVNKFCICAVIIAGSDWREVSQLAARPFPRRNSVAQAQRKASRVHGKSMADVPHLRNHHPEQTQQNPQAPKEGPTKPNPKQSPELPHPP